MKASDSCKIQVIHSGMKKVTMHTEKIDTIIIGAGISGIYVASLLAEKRESFVVLEARNRVGGRILSPDYKGYFTDLGPSWYWPEINPRIKGLIRELGLTGYPQYDTGYGQFQAVDGSVRTIPGYPMEPEAWRISGGMIALVDGLCKKISKDAVWLNHPVCEIKRKRDHALYQPPLGKSGIWDGIVLFAGTETSDQYGGYLEGALASAERAVYAARRITPSRGSGGDQGIRVGPG